MGYNGKKTGVTLSTSGHFTWHNVEPGTIFGFIVMNKPHHPLLNRGAHYNNALNMWVNGRQIFTIKNHLFMLFVLLYDGVMVDVSPEGGTPNQSSWHHRMFEKVIRHMYTTRARKQAVKNRKERT